MYLDFRALYPLSSLLQRRLCVCVYLPLFRIMRLFTIRVYRGNYEPKETVDFMAMTITRNEPFCELSLGLLLCQRLLAYSFIVFSVFIEQ